MLYSLRAHNCALMLNNINYVLSAARMSLLTITTLTFRLLLLQCELDILVLMDVLRCILQTLTSRLLGGSGAPQVGYLSGSFPTIFHPIAVYRLAASSKVWFTFFLFVYIHVYIRHSSYNFFCPRSICCKLAMLIHVYV